MLTKAPLPRWLDICRAILPIKSANKNLASHWHREGEVAGWLSRSTWSFALIALWRSLRYSTPVTVFLPDYFCNTALVALRSLGVKLVFYPLEENLAPDISACKALLESNSPDLFVLVHYFGKPIPVSQARDFCAHHGAWLIEDATHVLRPIEGVGKFGDFVLYSPYKHLAIPDGAVLVARPNGSAKLNSEILNFFGSPDSWYYQLRDLQIKMRVSRIYSLTHVPVWLIKRIIQKLGFIKKISNSKTSFLESITINNDIFKLTSPRMSVFSKRLLFRNIPSIFNEVRARQFNQLLWDSSILNNKDLTANIVKAAVRPNKREWTPYLAAYKVNLTQAEQIYDIWQSNNMPVTIWPDLPQEVIINKSKHSNAINLCRSRLYLPLHQSLNPRDIISRRLVLKPDQTNSSITLNWKIATEANWKQWMVLAGQSNLLQSWSYGEAKSRSSRWRVKHGVFFSNNKPIAIVQVLQKSFAGIFMVSRINRGPLFLMQPSLKELYSIWKKLAALGCICRGKILSVAPEMPLSGESFNVITNLGFKRLSIRTWESVMIDLNLKKDVLRNRLDGKWRNMLTFSEKTGLKIQISNSREFIDWIIDRYQELMANKDFSGTPVNLIRILHQRSCEKFGLVVLRAEYEGELVAGICLAQHGATATYLIGWNGQLGRKLKANQFLLWQAILLLKRSGFAWFDLGGISEEHTPGIAAFKLGLNGDQYELIGEYFKF